ncbi:hypothetical protein [Thermomonas sp.]|uniref:hypothetical protein n=1 Tax=Thermomonas sp. TaxID=1971895 RepID=UPI001B542BCB|nr:hypothetical protein [Thermomonas sp.]MBK6417528.1 hypothetical protein [Thermomonas sp.]MBK6924750.1 hypothetical protein [Thermomonas sp.]MBL0227598.1 hypothetical protein [Thermomonas sp.]MBP7159246.1 hypothetical protein [Thermomonas sp.]HQW59948.1 hypothetical protein [Thermomonas sp.]
MTAPLPALACFVALVFASMAASAADVRRDEARVLAAGDGRLLYRETHWTLPGPRPDRWVLYRCADGAAFARKRVLAAPSPLAPDFALEDARDGYREGVRAAAGGRSVFVHAPGRAEATRVLAIPADGVIDAGFDAAVRRHWPRLVRGEAVKLQFLVPSRKRFYPVQVQRVASVDWNGVPAERLRMRLDAWFGFAVPDVTLLYARDDQRLLEFAGTGNLRDGDGDHPQVRIVFERTPRTATAQELADARSLPLAGRCRF